jgi:hypothetical protein
MKSDENRMNGSQFGEMNYLRESLLHNYIGNWIACGKHLKLAHNRYFTVLFDTYFELHPKSLVYHNLFPLLSELPWTGMWQHMLPNMCMSHFIFTSSRVCRLTDIAKAIGITYGAFRCRRARNYNVYIFSCCFTDRMVYGSELNVALPSSLGESMASW